MTATMPLAGTQRAFAAWLLHRHVGTAPDIVAACDGERAIRLDLYADGYRWRLVDVLRHDYPVLRASLGQDRFDALAEAYLHAHPSRHPSVRHVGTGFARWLATRTPEAPALADLARLEWAQGEVFDAAEADTADIGAMATLPADAWPALRLSLHPAVRRVHLRSNAAALLEAHAGGAVLPALRRQPLATWLLWRHAFDVHWRRLARDEAAALAAVARGVPFVDWCARLPGPTPALRAAGLLKRWLTDGLLTGLRIP